MRNVMKATTLESKFPLLAVENGCIVSKEADVTVAFKVELPELFSVNVRNHVFPGSQWRRFTCDVKVDDVFVFQFFFHRENLFVGRPAWTTPCCPKIN